MVTCSASVLRAVNAICLETWVVSFSLQSLCLTHTGKPTGVAVSHCITWFQTQLIHTACQIRYHTHCGIIIALGSSEP